MNETPKRPSAAELAELEAYLAARQQGEEPAPGEAGFPSGLAGELLALAQQTHPDPLFAARLERRLQRAAETAAEAPTGQLPLRAAACAVANPHPS